MIIRYAQIKDIPAITEIYNYEVIHSTSTFDITIKSCDYFIKFLDKHNDHYPVFVIEEDSIIVGWGSLSMYSEKEAYKCTVENSIYIHNCYRSKGYGKKMLDHLINTSKNLGYSNIIAKISAENQNSIALHSKFGFIQVGKLINVGYKFNRWLDVVIMQLSL
ncbi:N-acetyltransferase family protein [Caldicellulosiruptoraceae bacterium PP1]